jgi:alpha-tubulin suppressor-like RCC1 family protein
MDLFEAAKLDEAVVVDDFLRNGGNFVNETNDLGLTGLHVCATYGSLNALLTFIRYGADLHIRDRESGWTALHRALYFGHVRVALILIKSGAKMEGKLAPQIYPWDNEKFAPIDLLTAMYENDLRSAKCKIRSSCVVSFGKADFTLGVPLPKASEVVHPKRVESLTGECIVQVVTNKHHTVAVTADGACYSWGHGRGGRLGHGSEASYPEPHRIPAFGTTFGRPRVIQITSGENHTAAVTSDGDVFCWGSDRFGQLGLGNTTVAGTGTPPAGSTGQPTAHGSLCLEPRRVDVIRREFAVAVAAGDAHTLCCTSRGELYAWGSNKSGQLGLKITEVCNLASGVPGSSVPKRVFIESVSAAAAPPPTGKASKLMFKADAPAGTSRILQICASFNNSLLVCKSAGRAGGTHEVYQWGHGIGTPLRVAFDAADKKRTSSLSSSEFIPVGAGRPVSIVEVAAGQHHYVALSKDGSVFTWGAGAEQLGHGQGQGSGSAALSDRVSEEGHLSTPRAVAALVPEGGRARVMSIAATSNRSCAVTARGELYTWGATEKQVGRCVRMWSAGSRVALTSWLFCACTRAGRADERSQQLRARAVRSARHPASGRGHRGARPHHRADRCCAASPATGGPSNVRAPLQRDR